MQTKGAKKAVRICEPEVEPSIEMMHSTDDNNNSNSSLKFEINAQSSTVESTTIASDGVTFEVSQRTDATLDDTYGLQMIEEDEGDFVRIESNVDSGYTSAKPSAKSCNFEQSESYL